MNAQGLDAQGKEVQVEKSGGGAASPLQHGVMPGSIWRFPMRNSKGKIQYYTRLITIVREVDWLVGGRNLTAFWDKPIGSVGRTHTLVEQISKGRKVA